MNILPPGSDPNDRILADIVVDVERCGSGVVEEHIQRHPDLEGPIRELMAVRDLVADSRPGFDPEAPERLGPFRIVRRMGGGGMGEIYEAIQEPLGRRVAVKIIRRGRESEEARRRFLREQEMLARLHHTHIVPIFAAGEEGTLLYFAMPYIEGAALDRIIQTARQLGTVGGSGPTPTLDQLAVIVVQSAEAGGKPPPPPGSTSLVEAEVSTKDTVNPLGKLRLSEEYVRSVAEVMAEVAEALQHAHDVGVLHRDIKPSNIMVGQDRACWVIDFGLAGYLGAIGRDETRTGAAEGRPSLTHGPMGTPAYMGPEQHKTVDGALIDHRSDVWGLGATLYELLAMQPPFTGDSWEAVAEKVCREEPTALADSSNGVPADLVAVCDKALQKDLVRRYPTALEFAGDLRRWLRHEPVRVRSASPLRRVQLWSRRNPGWAAACLAGLGVIALGAAHLGRESERKQEAIRQELMREAQALRMPPPFVGWRKAAWEKVEAASHIRQDEMLRAQAAAVLVGVDAFREEQIELRDSTAVLFDAQGKHLLIGGGEASRLQPAVGAEILDMADGSRTSIGRPVGSGAVAFRPDGSPVQLAVEGKLSLSLWDVKGEHKIQEYRVPGLQGAPLPTNWVRGGARLPVVAMTPDASVLAGSAEGQPASAVTVVWEGNTGKVLLQVAGVATAVGLTRDGGLLAIAQDAGWVEIWSIRAGKRVARFSTGNQTIYGLAFGPETSWEPRGDSGNMTGRLAIGGTASSLTIWNLHGPTVATVCSGPSHEVYRLTFNPDGTLLASGGRALQLWDAASGQQLLSLPGDYISSLAFTPDGQRIAASSVTGSGPGRVCVWNLDVGREIRTLRGLAAPVTKVCFSPDGRWLAALDHRWMVGIWDTATGRLHRFLRIQQGDYADNAALAFSPDGERFAYSAAAQARVLEVASGRELGVWNLPQGMVDHLAFHPLGKLLLFRKETADGKHKPYDDASSFLDFPRVCRIRELREPASSQVLGEIKEFNHGAIGACMTVGGSHVVVEGFGGSKGDQRSVRLFETLTSREVLLLPTRRSNLTATLLIDPTGQLLAYGADNNGGMILIALLSGRRVGSLDREAVCLGPGGDLLVRSASAQESWIRGYELVQRKEGKVLIRLGIDMAIAHGDHAGFDVSGRRLAWGNYDGTVVLCDLPELKRRLAPLGLDW